MGSFCNSCAFVYACISSAIIMCLWMYMPGLYFLWTSVGWKFVKWNLKDSVIQKKSFTFVDLADTFIPSELEKRAKAICQDPTILLKYSATFIRPLDGKAN